MRPEPSPRIHRGWYLGAVVAAVLAVGMGLLGWRQADQADRIQAHPVRVHGVVTALPSGSATYSEVVYHAGGRTLQAADLKLPPGIAVGAPVCLETAADDPQAVRACGQHYPQVAGVGLSQVIVPLSALVLLVCLVRIRRHRRAVAARAGFVPSTAVLASDGIADEPGQRARRGAAHHARR